MIEHESCEKNDRHEDIHSINLDFWRICLNELKGFPTVEILKKVVRI